MPSAIQILDRLIGFQTVSRRPNIDLIEYVRDLLEDRGIACRMIGNADGTNANLYASVGPDDRPGVMLSGHTDVVPVEGQSWTVDPFRMIERDGRLYGRGTTDMKGFVACAVRAMMTAAARDLTTPLHLALSYDEEIGCVGVRRMLDILESAPIRPRFCIVGEPTELQIATGHKGKLAARATCHGREVHSALAPTGINAIHLAAEFVSALRQEQDRLRSEGPRDGDYDIPYSTVHVGTIDGGTALNIVPNQCALDFEIRNIAQDDVDTILGRLVAAGRAIADTYPAGAAIGIETVNRYPGLDTAPDAEVVAFMKSLTGANATNKVAFGTEGGLFSTRLSIPTVICGPGSMTQGHKPDEYIQRSQIDACENLLARLIDRLAA